MIEDRHRIAEHRAGVLDLPLIDRGESLGDLTAQPLRELTANVSRCTDAALWCTLGSPETAVRIYSAAASDPR
jgi:hypothetical protein